jgi:hypothetical protein
LTRLDAKRNDRENVGIFNIKSRWIEILSNFGEDRVSTDGLLTEVDKEIVVGRPDYIVQYSYPMLNLKTS